MANLTKVFAGLLIAGALLLGLFALMLARREPPAAVVAQPVAGETQALTPVVVATRTLAAGQPIPADALHVKPLPIHPAGSYSDSAMVAGRVPLTDVAADTPVLDTQLTSSLAASLAPGERAVAVRVDETNAVGNQLRAGNVVDVFFTLHRDGTAQSGEIGRTQTRLLISKARVLVFGNPDDAAKVGAPRTSTFGAQAAAPRTAVIAVPLADVDTLALAQSQGQLLFALRNPTDPDTLDPAAFGPQPGVLKVVARDGAQASTSTHAAAGIALDQLAGGTAPHAASVAPSRAPGSTLQASRGGLEVIRGGQAERVAW
ncbi:Flp pilus assembly protein CpaB [Paraburkholderia acidisoli]|uniref:Flp pilus assembly protein CpaB n=1 Tax=Paraburkholderia acidisoli TaxID=2571748 RepID=A0A7Z2GH37_9BURK|nr:Flp pilus assembly protein CpaB [Paraburkholderia acidisoli]QGZ61697.1 Flp pilus assembly protein CpaB [Paraburkholderia acidisoli]